MDIVVSMMRSRDDNLILLNSNLLLSILNKCSPEVIVKIGLTNKGNSALLIIKAAINLIVLEPPFRPATMKCLYQLMTKTCSISTIVATDLPAEDCKRLKGGFKKNIGNIISDPRESKEDDELPKAPQVRSRAL